MKGAGGCCGGGKITKKDIVKLYRSMLKEAKGIPTPHRSQYVFHKVKNEFAQNKYEKEGENIVFQYRFGLTSLDTIKIQKEYLTGNEGDTEDKYEIPEFSPVNLFEDDYTFEAIKVAEGKESIITTIAKEDQAILDSITSSKST